MKTEVTSNYLVIQGIIKEAFFNESLFKIQSSGHVHSLLIAEIIEEKIRENSSHKKICFYSNEKLSFDVGESYSFHVNFHRYIINGEFIFRGLQGELLGFDFPDQLKLDNLRKTARSEVKNTQTKRVPVLLRTNSFHSEGSFVLDDTSSDGYGGKIFVPENFPIEIGTHISGKLGFNEEIGIISGGVVSALALKSSESNSDLYKIGVIQENKKSTLYVDERRTQSRFQTRLQITLDSLIHPGQSLVLDVDDISVNGFSGIPSQGSIISNVPIGAAFRLTSEKVKVRLTHFSKDRLHFHIVRRSTEEGIAWLRKMTPFIYPTARCSSKDVRELYRIFLQAGAVSHQYLKRHQIHEDSLIDTSTGFLDQSEQIHRWFVGNNSSDASFYISAMKFANCCWVLGDIVKVSDSNLEAKSPIRSFFQSFSEFAQSEASVGAVMIFWVKGHPLWEAWRRNLNENYGCYVLSDLKMSYFRINSSLVYEEKLNYDKILNKVIKKEDYETRRDVLFKLSKKTRDFLRCAFDFEEQGVGSFSMVRSSNLFERVYSYVEIHELKFLAIISKSQLGRSPNRFMDSLFLFLIEGSFNRDTIEGTVLKIARALSTEGDVIFPAVRLFHNEEIEAGTVLECMLLFPPALKMF